MRVEGGPWKKSMRRKGTSLSDPLETKMIKSKLDRNTTSSFPSSATTSGHSGHSRDRKKNKGEKTVHPNFVQRPIVKLCCFSVHAELQTEHFKAIPSRWEFQAKPGLNLKQMSHPLCVVVIFLRWIVKDWARGLNKILQKVQIEMHIVDAYLNKVGHRL